MSEPLGDLIEAISTLWNATASITGVITGGLWFGERPTGDQANPADGNFLPYAVFPPRDNRSRVTGYSCATEFSEHDILIRIYGATPELCRTYAAAVKAVFDSDSLALTLAEGSVISHRPGAGGGYTEADKGIFYVDLPYEFTTGRPRPA